MTRFTVWTQIPRPGLHVWREGTRLKLHLQPVATPLAPGWVTFECDLEPRVGQDTRCMLFEFTADGAPGRFENDAHQRVLPRLADGSYPDTVWFAEGAGRVLLADPRLAAVDHLTVRLISQRRYRSSELFLWEPASGTSRRLEPDALEADGPRFEVPLSGMHRHFALFKFVRPSDDGRLTVFEPEFANRLWCAADGAQVWTHSEAAELATLPPQRRRLHVRFRQQLAEPPRMRIWQENSDYLADVDGVPQGDGWALFTTELFTNLGYGLRFWNPDRPEHSRWEHPEATRTGVRIGADAEYWTLEGDHRMFGAEPRRDRALELRVALKPPFSALDGPLYAHAWINRARAPLGPDAPVGADGRVSLETYPEVVTSVKFRDAAGRWEGISRHPIPVPADDAATQRYVVLERAPLLEEPPPADQFLDPPFTIRRPGAYQEGDALHFVVHAPHHARARLIGSWTGWLAAPLPMHSTRDGTYWWARVPVRDLLEGLGQGVTDFHGERYQLLFNDRQRYQDPAAAWLESSAGDAASRLVRPDRFAWSDQAWMRPGWESLIIYQLHAARFTNRHTDEAPLRRIAREISDPQGYLRQLGVTAIQLLPINEVGSSHSWGYDPAFFYAVENDLGGPDALRELVDTCHRHGIAVLLDVVFNHAGTVDNILWEVARDSFFDGDTRWGAMVNFDHPQARHFFAQNLVYLAREYHVDGFRLDHTATIVHSGARHAPWSDFVRELGSGGGWDFLHALRHALVSEVGPGCILIAEHLPNEWSVTNFGGPLDSQWCDDFHDRLVDACRGDADLARLAAALQLGHTACDDWYKVTNYPESHDEVGNVRDRVSYVAGWGRGLRMSKVAAACCLLSRGIPMYFMGAESGEDRQFTFGVPDSLDLDAYLDDPDRSRLRAWWREMALLHRNECIQGPSPLRVAFAGDGILAFSRGQREEYFVVLNFSRRSVTIGLDALNLPAATYRELWNSTWPAFAVLVEGEIERSNGGRDARVTRAGSLRLPDCGVVVLERVD